MTWEELDIDPREAYPAECTLCGEAACICENRWDVEPGFFDEEEQAQ